jgi:hypothetical protein
MNNGDEIQPMTPYPMVEKRGLMPDYQRDGEFPVSRDWKDVDCKATGCMFNHQEKCMVPSLYAIGADGRCTGFKAKELQRKIDGD